MPLDEKSLAETSGLTFETRCAGAKQSLQMQWAALTQIAEDDLQFLQSKQERKEETAKESDNPVFLAFLEQMHAESAQRVGDSSSHLLSTVWQSSVELMRTMWGSDAVDFALAAMKHESKAN